MKRTIAIAALCAGIMLTTFPSQAKESGNVKINAKEFSRYNSKRICVRKNRQK